MNWRHELTLRRARGVLKGYCACGWQSTRYGSEQKIRDEYLTHTKLVEREGRSAREGGA